MALGREGGGEWVGGGGGGVRGGGGGGGRGGRGAAPPSFFGPGGQTHVFAPPHRLRPPIKLHSSSDGVEDVAKDAGPRL